MDRTVLVCGGRDYEDRERVFLILDIAHAACPIGKLIHGAARGADTLAADWALDRGVLCNAYPANWKELGPGAGPIRNQRMLENGKPEMVIAFPGGKGTADMIARAERRGVHVVRVRPSGSQELLCHGNDRPEDRPK